MISAFGIIMLGYVSCTIAPALWHLVKYRNGDNAPIERTQWFKLLALSLFIPLPLLLAWQECNDK